MADIEVKEKERYILVAVSTDDEEAAYASLRELEELLSTAGAEAASFVVQRLEHPDRTSYVGSGKALEIKEMLKIQDAVGIVCDDELSPSQLRNLSDRIDAKVLDRTLLILDIFASHAKTREGKIQVEIAQQKYRLSRLRGMGEALSRLGGGIGTRGPGETKLETDRRVIQRRIKILTDEIDDMKRVRETTRKKRNESPTPTVAIVGYTNAGKSSLLNKLSESDVLSEDMLFATLDPTTRLMALPDGQEVLITDTVGFINKLPHHLIDAFRSTLEEAKYADIILQLVDASSPQSELHCNVVRDTLKDLGVIGKPVITAWNKMDLVESAGELNDDGSDEGTKGREKERFKDFSADASIMISAKTGEGISELQELISEVLRKQQRYVEKLIPYSDTAIVARIRKHGRLIEEKYEENGIFIKAYVPDSIQL